MISGKFLGYFLAIFFLSYNVVIFQISFSQEAQDRNVPPPSVKAPPFIIARATGPSWTQVNFHVNATSASTDKISVYCNPSSGSAFPMGSTIVLCAAKDPVTNLVGYAMFNVTVKDSSPPTFKVPHSILKQADSPQGAAVTYYANASDTVDGHTAITCNPASGSIFPLGLNQVTCTAKDKSGNSAESSFRVIIGQTTSKSSSAGSGISSLSQNVTKQSKSPALTVSDNATAQSKSPALTVSDNATAQSKSPALTVSDNATAESTVDNIIVNDTEASKIKKVENSPNVNNGLIKVTLGAGENQRAIEGSLVKIKGVSIHDSGNEKLSFTWKQTGGKPISPEDARISSETIPSDLAPQIAGNTTNLSFEVTVPHLTTDNNKLTFEIIAKDDKGHSASDSIDIFVDKGPKLVGTDDIQNRPNILESTNDEKQNKSNLPIATRQDFDKSHEVSTSLNKGFTFVNSWGSFGKGNGRFDGQNDVDAFNDRVYVADYANHRIQVFDTNGNYLTKWGSYGEENGQIHKASALTIVPSGKVYLSDQFNHRVQVFTAYGTFVTTWGTKGERDGQFLHPHVPAVDSQGNIYVSDRDLANIQKFTGNGKFIMKWSEEGAKDGQLSKPESVIVDSKDNVYVADYGNHRIQKFTNDGKFMLKWGSKGIGDGEFNGPAGLSIDRNDNIYVTDKNNNRIQVFTADGTFLTKFGSQGNARGQFILPEGIGVDTKTGLVYVADTGNYRIQVFRPVDSTISAA